MILLTKKMGDRKGGGQPEGSVSDLPSYPNTEHASGRRDSLFRNPLTCRRGVMSARPVAGVARLRSDRSDRNWVKQFQYANSAGGSDRLLQYLPEDRRLEQFSRSSRLSYGAKKGTGDTIVVFGDSQQPLQVARQDLEVKRLFPIRVL